MGFMPFNKKSLPKSGAQDVRLEAPVPDFIPYACHYDPNTILTKNGELIQTIKIIGFSYEKVGAEKVDLRDTVRQAIGKSFRSNKFALWFHTIRRRTNLVPEGEYDEIFPNFLNDSWNRQHDWKNKYVNELYISVIRKSVPGKIKTPKEFVRKLFFRAYKNFHDNFLQTAWAELNETVENLLLELRSYGAKRLTTIETKELVYSEPLQFFGKIIHLTEEKMLMPVMDASEYLATHKVAFGNNTLEIKGGDTKRFGAVFTIKHYNEMSTEMIDHVLQLPQELIITQSMVFVPARLATKHLKYQDYVLSVSGDERLGKCLGLTDMMESDTGSPVDYGEQQISVCLLAETLDMLEQQIDRAVKAFNTMGVIAVREDIRMEETFWAQLPANFPFIKRQSYLNTRRLGGFASLNNFPAGQRSGNVWGPAVTVFHTAMGTPYFFNFHEEDNGHTTVVGPFGAGKTVLLNFLVSQARKFKPRLYFFDQHRASKVFIKALGGNYKILHSTTPSEKCRYNPLLLDDTPENRKFLHDWLGYLVDPSGNPLDEQSQETIAALVEHSFSIPREERRLSSLVHHFGDEVAAHFKDWIDEGKYAHLFDNETDSFAPDDAIQAYGMTQIVEEQTTLGPVLSYLFHRIELLFDGTPTMIVLDEAWKLVNNPIFAPGLGDWLDRLREHNVMVIFGTETVEDASKRKVTRTITEKIATQIFLPNPKADDAYTAVWGLTDEEFSLLRSMELEQRHFLMKHGSVAVVGTLDLYGLDAILAVLSGGDDTVELMKSIISEIGDNPNDWLPVFCERVSQRN